tara:strand:- start:343 stop:1053 length:711 start_codon:yes stop_codon:yes gene_type:complete
MNKRKIVYWAPYFVPQEINHWNMLFIEPQKLLNKVIDDIKNTDDDRLKDMIRCPAFSNLGKNTFYVENPMTTEFDIIDGEIKYKGDNFYYCSILKGKNIFKYGLSYIFFSEDDLELMMTSPHFSQTEHTNYARLVPGKFNIAKWFRPVNLEMLLYGDKSYFKMPEHEHMAYFTFLTDDKVELKRFELNDTLLKISNTCSNVSDWWKNVPLINRYDRFLKTKTNRLVMKQIRKQLVE